MRTAAESTPRRAAAFRLAVLSLGVAAFFMVAAPLWAVAAEPAHKAAAVEKATDESSREAVHEGGWATTDWLRIMNFAVLAIGLFILLRKPAAQAFSTRIKDIKNQLEDLEHRKEQARKELAKYAEELSKLDQRAQKIVADYIRQGEEAKTRILKAAEASAEKLEEQARRNIENEFKRAKAQLMQEVMEKAMARAEEMVKRNITADDQDRLVDEYLEKVVA